MSSLGGQRIAALAAFVRHAGAWWADVLLEPGVPAPAVGATTLRIGADLSLVGAVDRVDEEAPKQYRAIVRGAAGLWRGLARAESWQSDAGVKLRTILKALAKATEETVAMPVDEVVADAYGWAASGPLAASTGAMVLDDLVLRGALPSWHVAPSGGVLCEAWPVLAAADGKGRLLRRDTTVGMRVMGLDTRAAAFLPGATVEGRPIARAVFRERAEELRVEAWER